MGVTSFNPHTEPGNVPLSPMRVLRLRGSQSFPPRPANSTASALPSAPAGSGTGTEQAGEVAEIQPLPQGLVIIGGGLIPVCHQPEPRLGHGMSQTGCHTRRTQGRRRPHLGRETRKCCKKRGTEEMRSLRGHWSFATWRWWEWTPKTVGGARKRQGPGPQASRRTVLKSAPTGLRILLEEEKPTF